MEAGAHHACGGGNALLTAEDALRRALILENTSLPAHSRTTSTLTAAVQLVRPGETAPAHRHTPSALRFMLEGDGAFTAVGGERTTMRKGDFIITPAWAWHDHGNEGKRSLRMARWPRPAAVRSFSRQASNEHYNDDQAQIITRPYGRCAARFGSNLLPLSRESRYGRDTPIFNYPFAPTRAALVAAARRREARSHMRAVTLRYSNPLDGGWAMPTMAAWMTLLARRFRDRSRCCPTDGVVMALAEGRI